MSGVINCTRQGEGKREREKIAPCDQELRMNLGVWTETGKFPWLPPCLLPLVVGSLLLGRRTLWRLVSGVHGEDGVCTVHLFLVAFAH